MFAGLTHAVRIARMAVTLARHDALFPLTLLGAPRWIERTLIRLIPPRAARGRRPGQRLAAALQALGPSFIKFGQSLATRSDLIGEDVARDLSELQDKLPPFAFSHVREIIGLELDHPIDEIFESFDHRPVAAASIAQVHFAELKSGEPVAVKVLRPDIARAFARDIAFFRWLARRIERFQPDYRRLKPVEVVETFAHMVTLEMDLRYEAAAASELAENFAGDARVHIPKIYWTHTGHSVLTLERIEGIAVDEVERLRASGLDPREVLTTASSVFFTQVFRDGFFHADLHPGNIFIESDGTFALVDFGITGRLDRETRYYLADMLLGFLQRDYRRVAEVHFEAGYIPADQSIDAFTQACRSIAEPILGLPMNQISVARLLGQLFQITETFEMEAQPQLLLLQKSMLVAEGIGRRLDPSVNMWELTRPLIEDWMRAHRGPEARLRDAAGEVGASVSRLPGLLTDLERAVRDMISHGIRLHPETVARLRGADGAKDGRSTHRAPGGGLTLGLALGLSAAALLLALAALF